MSTPMITAPTDRRGFFKRAGLGLGAVAAVSTLQACDSDPVTPPPAGAVTLDFSSDVGVLNYAYALEQLEAGFYATVIANSAFSSTFSSSEQAILRDIAAHEAIHDDFFKTAIMAAAPTQIIPRLTADFSSINFANKASVLGTAQVFEDLGVSAYNGAGRFIASDDYLTLAGKIVSVEARHASIISGLLQANAISSPGQLDANALDISKTPQMVIGAASTYIVETINVTNAG